MNDQEELFEFQLAERRFQEIKTSADTKVLPMTADVEECFRKIISNRLAPKREPEEMRQSQKHTKT